MSEKTTVGPGEFGRITHGARANVVAEPLEARRLFATVTVTGTADVIAIDGLITLREAISAISAGADSADVVADVSADAYGTNDTILFNIPGTGVKTIPLVANLPGIVKPLTIDGYSQSGASPNTLAEGNDAVINVEIDANGFQAIQLDPGSGSSTVQGLAIYQADLHAFRITSDDNVITGNYVGLRADGTTGGLDQFIQFEAIELTDASDNRIGGTSPADRNVIGNSRYAGIAIRGSGAVPTGNIVQGNYIGTDRTGTAPRGILGDGILIFQSDGNTIGGTDAGARNVISASIDDGGPKDGIRISGSSNNLVQGNYIGTDVTGALDLGNAGSGVRLEQGSTENTIGGAERGAGNVISGNANDGVSVSDDTSSGNIIQGNYIGTSAAGDAALPNAGNGVTLHGPDSLLGGTESGAGNLISGNSRNGVLVGIQGKFTPGLDGSNAVIQGNIIGLDAAGASAIANGEKGITTGELSANLLIGGAQSSARNVISGNSGVGIETRFSSGAVLGNYIGTDASGEIAVPNRAGVVVDIASSLTIGGGNAGEGNLISGNSGHGVFLLSGRNAVQGNQIGLSATGLPLGNDGYGIRSDSDDNLIGGANDALGNVIAYNGFGGVGVIQAGGGNSIRHNSIFSNIGIGIDLLGGGITPNDPGDADTGPNNFQNFPVLVSAQNNNAGGTVITGTINSTPNTQLLIDFYTDTNAAAEGRTHVGSVLVTTDGSGNAAINFTIATALTPGLFLTATASTTATDPYVDTSEFSQAVQVAAAPPQTPPSATGLNDLVATKKKGGSYAFTGVVARFTSTAFNSANSFSATINWGDGTSSAGQIVFNANLNKWEVIGTHQYVKKGRYTLLVTITDANGKTATATSVVTAK